MLDQALKYNQEHREQHLERLKALLRIPSISTLAQHRGDVLAAAAFVCDELRAIGFSGVEAMPGQGDEHPLIKGEWLGAPGKPTVLLYAHYDVQPVDPLSEWVSKPFEPHVSDGKLWARGSGDDKGQLWILLKALESFMKTAGSLPVNIKVLFEGEEESNGTHIERFVTSRPDYLKGITSALVLDSGMFAAGIPTITTGLRGIITSEIVVRGSNRDLHSGEFGGAAPNPLQALSAIIAAMKTPSGRVRIPGFYKQVRKPSEEELASWKSLPFDEEAYLGSLGARGLIGDRRYSVLRRLWALPTLEINGMSGGFSGDGFKTVIPASASAKVSMRLVPGMDPQATADLYRRFVACVTPAYVSSEVRILAASQAMLVDIKDRAISAAARALQETFGRPVAYTRNGGSIPVAGTFQSVLAVPVLITGFTLPDCNEHAPNENLDIGNFYAGIDAVTRYFDTLGR